MPAKPTPGGSSGTWGTELNDYLDVSIETDGSILAASVTADSTTLVGTGTNVQAVLEELDNGIADHLADTSAAHAASAISANSTTLVGTGTDVQAVFEELDDAIVALQAPTYIVQTASSTLANEQATGALATGILKSTTTTGALTIATGADLPTGIPIASLADPTTGKVIGSTASAAAAVFPPGYQLGYVEQTNATQATTQTVQASATTLLTMGSITFDGTACIFEFQGIVGQSASVLGIFNLWEDSTDVRRLCVKPSLTSAEQLYSRIIYTPAAGAKVFTVRMWVASASTMTVYSGDPTTNTNQANYLRITKA